LEHAYQYIKVVIFAEYNYEKGVIELSAVGHCVRENHRFIIIYQRDRTGLHC